MAEDELLGSENQARLKELGLTSQDSIPANSSIVTSLTSPDTSIRRDAALAIISVQTEQQPSAADTTLLLPALCRSLSFSSPPGDASGNTQSSALAVEASLAALHCCLRTTNDDDVDDELLPLLLPAIAAVHAQQDLLTATARRLLGSTILQHSNGEDEEEARQGFIVEHVLRRYLRPIFSGATAAASSVITAEGRPVLFPATHPSVEGGGVDVQRRAWKTVVGGGADAVAVFAWAVSASKPSTLEKYWPLYVPVLATLIEDDDLAIRLRGLDILDAFLATCPPNVVGAAGVDALFREAVFPSLLFLPTLTPEDDSVVLLRAAYRVLLALARGAEKDDDDDGGGGGGGGDRKRRGRRRLLDRMLRDGVLVAYFHASQHIRVVEVLMQSARQIVEALGIYAVKHLQSLLDLFDSVLTDPFTLAYTPAVLAAAEALNATIRTCWPRIVGTPHAEQIIYIVARSWTNVHDSAEAAVDAAGDEEKSAELQSLCAQLSQAMSHLAALWEAEEEGGSDDNARAPVGKLVQVVSKAPHLKPLLEPFQLDQAKAHGTVKM